MVDSPVDFQVGGRIQYVEGTVSWGVRRGQVGAVTAIFPHGTSGPRHADVKFENGVE